MSTRSVHRFLLTALASLVFAVVLRAQTPGCPEADKINPEFQAAENEYERTLAQYRQGLFCSECKRPKHQIEAEEKIPFEQHLVNVRGQAYSATQAMYDEAKRAYQAKYEGIRTRYNQALANCMEQRNRELERQRLERERKQREEEEKRREEARKYQDAQRQAEEKRKAEAEAAEQKKREEEAARARAAEEKRREEERILQEMQRRAEEQRRLYEQHLAELRQEVAGMLAAANDARESRIAEIAGEVRGALSKYTDQAIGQASAIWDVTQSGISAYAREKAGEMLAQGGPDDENFDAISATKTVVTGIRDGWTAIVDRAGIIGFAEDIGITRPLKFGQTGLLKAIESTLNDLPEGLSLPFEAVESGFHINVEDRAQKIIRVDKVMLKNALNNLTFLPLGDWLVSGDPK